MKPSDIQDIKPYGSTASKSEAETVAQNIVTILARTGDKWRKLSLRQYVRERKKDGNFSSVELIYFENVVGFTQSPSKARLFSGAWNIRTRKDN